MQLIWDVSCWVEIKQSNMMHEISTAEMSDRSDHLVLLHIFNCHSYGYKLEPDHYISGLILLVLSLIYIDTSMSVARYENVPFSDKMQRKMLGRIHNEDIPCKVCPFRISVIFDDKVSTLKHPDSVTYFHHRCHNYIWGIIGKKVCLSAIDIGTFFLLALPVDDFAYLRN